MKTLIKIACILSLSLLFAACNTNVKENEDKTPVTLPDYPGYEQVVDHLLKRYDLQSVDYSNYLRLTKRKDGWHVEEYTYKPNESGEFVETIAKDQLFWSRKQHAYKSLNFRQAKEGAAISWRGEQLQQAFSYGYNNVPYYGYDGWYKDVIDQFGNKQNYSDTMLNAMARAYSAYATQLLGDQFGTAIMDEVVDLPDGQNSLTSEQLKTYRQKAHKAIEFYEKLMKSNPDFETYIGKIDNVYANEHLNIYLTLLYFQNREEALKELKEGLYDDLALGMARRYLNSCDSNAILFTYGDNDTYPLLYIQEMMGFRTDVSVINTSLSFNPRYITHLRKKEFVDHPVTCELSDQFYNDDRSSIVRVSDAYSSGKYSVREALDFVASDDPVTKMELQDKMTDFVPSRDLWMNVPAQQIPGFRKLYHKSPSEIDQLSFSIMGSRLIRSDLFILDILSSNDFYRPVYFAGTSFLNDLGLQNNYQQEGMVLKLMPYSGEDMNCAVQYQILMKKINYPLPDTLANVTSNKNSLKLLRLKYSLLANQLASEKKNDLALNTLNYIKNSLERQPYDPDALNYYLAKVWLTLGNKTAAEQYIAELLEEIKQDVDNKEFSGNTKISLLKDMSLLCHRYLPESDLTRKLDSQLKDLGMTPPAMQNKPGS